MLQDPVVAKHPDHNLGMLSCSRAAATMDRSQKSNPHQPEQPLNCPRCDSTNTKFCYYNNYSLAQPRHFCKNCRRYWTKGGALRNVPIGGGCRKNKRIKQRALDPSSLVGSVLDETTSNMLASINRAGSCSSFMASLSPSTPGLLDLSNESHGFGLTLSRLQESLRLKEQSGAVRSDLSVYDLGIGNSQTATELLSGSSCSKASLISSLPPRFNTNFMGFTSSMVKQEQGALYSSPDLSPLFEAHPEMANPTIATSSALEQFSPYSAPAESFNGEAHEQNNLTLQLVHDDQVDRDQGNFFPAVAEETKEYLRNVKGKPIMSSFPDQWQGMHDNYYETEAANSHYMWMNNIGWPEFQAMASSAGGGMQ